MKLFSVVTTCVKDNHSYTNTMLFSTQEKADECFDLIKKQFLTEYASELEEPTTELDNIFIAKGTPCANFNEFKMTLSKHILCDSDEYLSQFGDYKPIYSMAVNINPNFKQYQKYRKKYDFQDLIIFIDNGNDEYELFNEDAKIASNILSTTLKHNEGYISTSIKKDELSNALKALIRNGYRAAAHEPVKTNKKTTITELLKQ